MGGNVAIPVCGLWGPWQNGQLVEQQINGSAAFVIGLQQCQPKPYFGAGDGGNGDLLQQTGQPIGDMDTQIAAHALALGLPLVTHNTRHFKRVAGLRLEDWMT